jgi:hypothetical protein
MTSRWFVRTMCAAAMLSAPALLIPAFGADAPSAEDLRIAQSLATMLQSARAVISTHQKEINDPTRGDKGLSGAKVLDEAIHNYQERAGKDPRTIDQTSYEGRLLKAQMDSVVEVMDANQAMINAKGVEFKGLIPATFARLVNEAFARRVGAEATIKVTAPPELVRNRRARPDVWEITAIKDYLQKADWPRGKIYSGVDTGAGTSRARIMVPEYYSASCLSCHGEPKGALDMTGYPKEGAHENDLGGVISIGLTPQ